MKNSHQPIEVILIEGLLADLLGQSCDSDGMLCSKLFPVFGLFISVELLVVVDRSFDGLVEAQVISTLFVCFLGLESQHLEMYQQ